MTETLRGALIIFDLDGTLVDTAPDLVRALNATVAELELPPVPEADVRMMVGRGARALLRQAFARLGAGCPEPRLDLHVQRFIAHYEENIAAGSRPRAGAAEAMDAFDAAGATMTIATNKPQRLTMALLNALDLTDRFARVVGADAARRRKPHPGHLADAAPDGKLDRAVMIGDSATDVAAARAAGAPVIVIRDGYSEIPVEALGADAVIDDLAAAPRAAADLLAAAATRRA